MRQLAETERLLVEKIVQLKQAARLEELQVARLLRKELECFALRWVLEPKKTLLFYSIQNKTDWNVLRKNYFQVADFLYLIEELEKDRFVKIQTLSFEVETDEERVLYDRGKYRYNSSNDTFWGIKGDVQYLVPINAEHKVYIDFVSYLERYANKVIYPLPLLEDFVANNYKSIEQRNFEKQIEESERHHQAQMKVSADQHEKQISKTNYSLVIAAIALITSATMPFLVNRCTPPTEIDNAQLKAIEQAIINSKTAWPNAINIQSSDTLSIKNILPSQK
ncbi:MULTISPECIES: hypothetical protein [Bacteroidales]|jgi:hypothetical protein|uniref:hypothetical protein n=1 Tax=Bacteroidales TaxID=171549 RepID=UPI000E511694|nr:MULTISPECIES: hypothetical protein [Bacteroidales]RHE45413.1 hypothetical protein DW735_09265 [Bacteroides stercoris]